MWLVTTEPGKAQKLRTAGPVFIGVRKMSAYSGTVHRGSVYRRSAYTRLLIYGNEVFCAQVWETSAMRTEELGGSDGMRSG